LESLGAGRAFPALIHGWFIWVSVRQEPGLELQGKGSKRLSAAVAKRGSRVIKKMRCVTKR